MYDFEQSEKGMVFKMKIVNKIVIAILCIILINCIGTLKAYASENEVQVADLNIVDMLNKANSFKNTGAGNAKISIGDAERELLPMGPILVAAASIILVIVTGILGIKFIIADPKEKGKLKQQAIGLVVAIVVVYGATGIWIFARSVLEGL